MTSDRPTARELELTAAAAPTPSRPPAPSLHGRGEALAMMVRRGFAPSLTALDLPFDPALPEPAAALAPDPF